MKALLLTLLATAALCGTASAQSKSKKLEVPAAVQASFKKAFPRAEKAQWEKDGVEYDVKFQQGSTEMEAEFAASGALLMTEIEITTASLPAAVATAVKRDFPNGKLLEATKLIKAGEAKPAYEVEVRTAKETEELIYNEAGIQIGGDDDDEDDTEEGDDD